MLILEAHSKPLAAPMRCWRSAEVWLPTFSAHQSRTDSHRLYRQLGTSCGAASGVQLGDYLTTAGVFTAFSHTTGCGCLASLAVDLPVSLRRSSTIEAYELTDTIYLRNSTRI